MQTGSLINLLMDRSKRTEPTIGGPATILHWTDREAATVVAIENDGKTVTVQSDKATRIDKNGMSDAQAYAYETDPQGGLTTFKRARNGKYTTTGRNSGGNVVVFGYRSTYHDYSF